MFNSSFIKGAASATALFLLSIFLVYCAKEDIDITAQPQSNAVYAATVASAGAPCDSIEFIPVAFGSMIRMIPQTIAAGSRKGLPWWQGKGFVFSKIPVTNYQQDSLKERMVFADTVSIKSTDTFYICRKIVK